MDSDDSRSDWIFGITGVATGIGVLTFALFPLALPIVILTIVATLPLLLPVVVLGAGAAILAGIWLAIRAAGRGARRLRRPTRAARAPATLNRAPSMTAHRTELR
jgi:hypothetical protein